MVAIHPHPFRFVTYMDGRHADVLGLSGAANVVYAEPAAGYTITDVRRALFELPAVAGAETVSATAEVIRDLFEQVTGILRVIEGAVLALALLIAFNSANISSDERRREHATMFAFGVPLRIVMRILVVESFVVGVIGTAVGFGRRLPAARLAAAPHRRKHHARDSRAARALTVDPRHRACPRRARRDARAAADDAAAVAHGRALHAARHGVAAPAAALAISAASSSRSRGDGRPQPSS